MDKITAMRQHISLARSEQNTSQICLLCRECCAFSWQDLGL